MTPRRTPGPIARAASALSQARTRRRMERLHRRLVPPERLTVGALYEAAALLGISADALLAGSAGVPASPPTLADGQAFLDITHPGHGLVLSDLRAGDAQAVLGVAAANFFAAPLMKRLARLGWSPTSARSTAASIPSAARHLA